MGKKMALLCLITETHVSLKKSPSLVKHSMFNLKYFDGLKWFQGKTIILIHVTSIFIIKYLRKLTYLKIIVLTKKSLTSKFGKVKPKSSKP